MRYKKFIVGFMFGIRKFLKSPIKHKYTKQNLRKILDRKFEASVFPADFNNV